MTADASNGTVFRSFTRAHLDGALALLAPEGWQTYNRRSRAHLPSAWRAGGDHSGR